MFCFADSGQLEEDWIRFWCIYLLWFTGERWWLAKVGNLRGQHGAGDLRTKAVLDEGNCVNVVRADGYELAQRCAGTAAAVPVSESRISGMLRQQDHQFSEIRSCSPGEQCSSDRIPRVS